MAFTRGDMLATAERSSALSVARDRSGWVGMFTPDGLVEDPVGAGQHRGRAAIAHFYDTFIGPRQLTFHPDVDIVVGSTVIRDLELEVQMAAAVTLWVPTYIRYDVQADDDETKIAALQAFWELPAMVGQFLRCGVRALPAGLALSRALMTNQGFSGTLDYVGGLKGSGAAGKRLFARFLDAAGAGDEVGMRRHLANDVHITSADDVQLSAGDLTKHLAGARWRKLVASGRFVVAATERAGQRSVLFGEVGHQAGAIERIRVFSEAATPG